jgi:predicted glycogen debranching enzyme
MTNADAALVRRIDRSLLDGGGHWPMLAREWLVSNGLGGYASGTIAGVATRRYHGLLIAALPAPFGRRMLLSHVTERLRLPDRTTVKLAGEQYEPGDINLYGADYLTEFRLEHGLPVWRYRVKDATIEKQIVLPHAQNTVYVIYRLVDGASSVRLTVMPSIHHRSHDADVDTPLPGEFRLTERGGRYELATGDLPPLRLRLHGEHQSFTVERQTLTEVLYRIEETRGYAHQGFLWSPGFFRVDLTPEQPAALVGSAEPWDVVEAMTPEDALAAEQERRARRISTAHPAARHGMAAELVLAADQFIIRPVGRTAAAARAHARGDDVRTVIAGYHWFTDWGRDTMISLEGLTLSTGREEEAGCILRTFASFLKNGLLPNMFPEGGHEGLYHTADATLWFFHAIHRYLLCTQDRATAALLLPKLIEVAEHHLRGTDFGIGVDPADGLLRQGAPGYQLTWMDAKVEDWVVTPRRGKAVEINALWYNALCLLADWVAAADGESAARVWRDHAEQARASFNARFWYEQGGYLYDVIDGEHGDDAAFRPNQLFAISLDHPVLDPARREPVLEQVRERLLTPVGLRSLAADHPDYRSQYYGDLRARDAAYHQGTVWAWLIGPFVDAWLRVHPDDVAGARRWLDGFERHLSEGCIGSISEIFDAEPPFTSRGCVAQAWSVAEVLRLWVRTAEADEAAQG